MTCFCSGCRSCKVVQEVNFKNIVVFSMKGMFNAIEHVILIEQKLWGYLVDDVVSHKNNYMSVVTYTIIYTILVVWICCTLLSFCSLPNQVEQFHKKNDWNSSVRNAHQSMFGLHPL